MANQPVNRQLALSHLGLILMAVVDQRALVKEVAWDLGIAHWSLKKLVQAG
jgi:hypothetical protein